MKTVWMARMGQQPFLYAVYEDAFRLGLSRHRWR